MLKPLQEGMSLDPCGICLVINSVRIKRFLTSSGAGALLSITFKKVLIGEVLDSLFKGFKCSQECMKYPQKCKKPPLRCRNHTEGCSNLLNRMTIENCKGFRLSLFMLGSCHVCMNCPHRHSNPHKVKLVDNCFKFTVDDLPLFCMFGKVLLRLFISLSKDDALSRDLILCNNFEGLQILGQLGRVWQ